MDFKIIFNGKSRCESPKWSPENRPEINHKVKANKLRFRKNKPKLPKSAFIHQNRIL